MARSCSRAASHHYLQQRYEFGALNFLRRLGHRFLPPPTVGFYFLYKGVYRSPRHPFSTFRKWRISLASLWRPRKLRSWGDLPLPSTPSKASTFHFQDFLIPTFALERTSAPNRTASAPWNNVSLPFFFLRGAQVIRKTRVSPVSRASSRGPQVVGAVVSLVCLQLRLHDPLLRGA